MKKIIFFTFLLMSFISMAQKNQREINNKAFFAATEKGEPDGKKTTEQIGKDGGTIRSSDNRVELIFSAGALSSNTTISIQPITNLAQGGIGRGYSMEPSGIHFNQPVTFVFHYTDKDTEGDSPELMGLATQDENGLWHQLNKIVVDTLAKTVTGNVKHFSLLNPQWKILLQPRYSKVKVSKEDRIILAIAPKEGGNPEPGEIEGVFDFIFGDVGEFINKWYVDGVLNGNSSVGFMSNQTFQSETYKAPALVPTNNPVKISVEIYSFNTLSSLPFRKSCYVAVYDNAYEVKLEARVIGKGHYTPSYKDRGSFLVSLEKGKVKVFGIENQLESFKAGSGCTAVILNPGLCTGMIDIKGMAMARITPPNPPAQQYPIIEIAFIKTPIVSSIVSYDCAPPPGIIGRSIGVFPPPPIFMMSPALPQYIKFIAMDEEQTILQIGNEGDDIFLKASVKKLKD